MPGQALPSRRMAKSKAELTAGPLWGVAMALGWDVPDMSFSSPSVGHSRTMATYIKIPHQWLAEMAGPTHGPTSPMRLAPPPVARCLCQEPEGIDQTTTLKSPNPYQNYDTHCKRRTWFWQLQQTSWPVSLDTFKWTWQVSPATCRAARQFAMLHLQNRGMAVEHLAHGLEPEQSARAGGNYGYGVDCWAKSPT